MRRALVVVAAACVSCTLLVDTSDLSGGPGKTPVPLPEAGGAEGGTSTGAFELSLAVPTLNIAAPGGSGDVVVTLLRRGEFSGPVSIALGEGALGLSAPPIVLDGAATTGTLTVTSAASAMLGTRSVEVRGSSGAESATAPLGVHVGGPSGTIDTSYGAGGFAIITADSVTHGYDIDVQPDGKPLIGGDCVSDKDDFFVARTLTNGSLDPSFGTNGVFIQDFLDTVDYGFGLSLLPDGRILVLGAKETGTGETADFGMVRVSAEGVFDPTFGPNGGEITANVTGGYDAASQAHAVDGKLLIVGSRFFVTRYLDNGQIDPTYGDKGKAIAKVGTIDDLSYASALTRTGGVVLTGYTTKSKTADVEDHDGVMVRFTAEGKVDTTFAQGGIFTLSLGTNDDALGRIVALPDGRYLVAGQDASRGFVLRLTENGQIDTTFGTLGFTYLTKPGRKAFASGIALQNDKILVAGGMSNGSDIDVMVARLDANGALDPTFGAGGVSVAPAVPGKDDSGYDLALAPNGYVYVGGETADVTTGANARGLLMRFWP